MPDVTPTLLAADHVPVTTGELEVEGLPGGDTGDGLVALMPPVPQALSRAVVSMQAGSNASTARCVGSR